MKHLMMNLSLLIGILVLTACSTTSGGGDQRDDTGVEIKPVYNEKVHTVRAEDLKPSSVCPSSVNGKEDWRRQVSQANACVKSKNWAMTEKVGESLAIGAPLTPWGPYFLALAAESRKDYPRAQWMIELALKKAPNEGLFHYQLARLHWALGNESGAIKEFKQASDLNPTLVEAHAMVAQIALQRGDLGQSRDAALKALALDPKHGPTLMTRAACELKGNDFAKAEEALKAAIAVYPRDPKPRIALAQVQEMHLKKFAEALQTYKQLRQLSNERKLDESVQMNLDERIRSLEKAQSPAANQLSERRPTAEEGQVK